MGVLRILIFFLLLCSSAWGACTDVDGTITCTMDSTYDNATGRPSSYDNTYGGIYTPYTDNTGAAFMRWKVNIPSGATITSAYIQFRGATSTGTPTATISLIEDIDCDIFTSNPWSRSVTGSVSWSPAAWVNDGTYDSADIKTLVDAWTGLESYTPNAYIGFKIINSGSSGNRQAYSYTVTNQGVKAPKLIITYTGGSPSISYTIPDCHVRTKCPINVILSNHSATDQLVVFVDDVEKYRSADMPAESKISVATTHLTAGTHHIDIEVQNASNTPYAATQYVAQTFTTLHDGYPKVGINENNAICIRNAAGDGCDLYFPITGFQLSVNQMDAAANLNLSGPINQIETCNGNISTGPLIGGYSEWSEAAVGYMLDAFKEYGWRNIVPYQWNGYNKFLREYLNYDWAPWTETFEESKAGADDGYDDDSSRWSEAGTVDPDYATSPAPLIGTQSILLDGTAADATITYTLAAADNYNKGAVGTVSLKVALREITDHAATDILRLYNSSDIVIGRIVWNADKTVSIYHCDYADDETKCHHDGGDGDNQVQDWVLTGRTQMDYYYSFASTDGTITISLYSDAALTALVAQGSRVGAGSVTMAEQNASGISGTVTINKYSYNYNGYVRLPKYTSATTLTADAATRYLWYNWRSRSATASEADAALYWSTTATKPAYATLSQPKGYGYGAVKYIKLYASHGVKIIYDDFGSTAGSIKSFTTALKANDGVLAWAFGDEPNLSDVSRYLTWVYTKDVARQNDTDHPVFTLLYGYDIIGADTTTTPVPESSRAIRGWCVDTNAQYFSGTKTTISDILSFDIYPYDFEAWDPYSVHLEGYLLAIDNMVKWNKDLITIGSTVEVQDDSDYLTYYRIPIDNPVGGDLTEGNYLKDGSGNYALIYDVRKMTDDNMVDNPLYRQHVALRQDSAQFVVNASDTLTEYDAGKIGTTGVTVAVSAASGNLLPKSPTGGAMARNAAGNHYTAWYQPSLTPAQLHNLTWTSIIHGMKYLAWWHAFMENPPDNVAQMATEKTYIETLKNYILAAPSSKETRATGKIWCAASVQSGSRVDYIIREYGGTVYLFAARVLSQAEGWPKATNTNAITATFSITGLEAGTTITAYDESGRTITAGAGTFSDTFTEYGVHIYSWPGGAVTDETAPIISSFTIPETDTDLTLAISTFSCADETSGVYYCLSETNSSTGCTWVAIQPTSYTFATEGNKTLYAFCKDDSGNISVSSNDTTAITLGDTTAPQCTEFVLPSTSTDLTITITTWTCTDDTAVTGYCYTLTNDSSTCSWATSEPALIEVPSDGAYTFYAFCKDAAGNISADAATDSVTVTKPTYTVTPYATAGCTISPSLAVTVTKDAIVQIEVTANSGYTVTNVEGCGGTWGSNPYITGLITENCVVNAVCGPSQVNQGAGGTITIGTPDQGIIVFK
jgi:hypothetical protein